MTVNEQCLRFRRLRPRMLLRDGFVGMLAVLSSLALAVTVVTAGASADGDVFSLAAVSEGSGDVDVEAENNKVDSVINGDARGGDHVGKRGVVNEPPEMYRGGLAFYNKKGIVGASGTQHLHLHLHVLRVKCLAQKTVVILLLVRLCN